MDADGGGVMGGAQQHQCKINLLEHIEAVQEEVTDRMDFIERELDGMPYDPQKVLICYLQIK